MCRYNKSCSWEAYNCIFVRSALKGVLAECGQKAPKAGAQVTQLLEQFRQYDIDLRKLQRLQLIADIPNKFTVPSGSDMGPRKGWTELALVTHQTSLQRPSMSIRNLMRQAGAAITSLMPCIMMSPMSVAQYLEPGRLQFDLLVIDEASQMKPEDALGLLSRARQVVIVGDPKQLPPSSFFTSMTVADGDGDEEESASDIVEASILEMAMACWKPVRMLKWHYRSKHQDLIRFSNAHFYDSKLMVPHNPSVKQAGMGVQLTYVSGNYRKSQNQIEAEALVKAAIEFMKANPQKSLGIVSVNQTQRELIELLMDNELMADPIAAAYREYFMKERPLDRFFIKNLENVQGDERDAIFISTVYGPNEAGKILQNFGPINGEQGGRRLNVLFTRAREFVHVFTSLRSSNIDVAGKSHGVQILRDYLLYAESGASALTGPTPSGEETESPFEDWVRSELISRGYQVDCQIGEEGFRIDLAVKNPAEPNTYILGIECDGAPYHSSRYARDRDILREQVLRGKGWDIYRIWSTDWYRNTAYEKERLLNYLQQVCQQQMVA